MSIGRRISHAGGVILGLVLPLKAYWKLQKIKIKLLGRPYIPAETSKARKRRENEGFFEKYIQGRGIDIGCGGDILTSKAQPYDFEHGDAQTLNGLKKEEKFDYVYSSHTLEHMPNPRQALRNWANLVKKEGYLILYLPHRDLFEKKKNLPSQWNSGHTTFFMPGEDEKPDTIGVRQMVEENLKDFKIVYIKVCDENYKSLGQNKHSEGEYSIEAVLRKI